jgi:hypothetical protein
LDLDKIPELVSKINKSPATHMLVGGSSFEGNNLNELIIAIKSKTSLPILLFPGHSAQISAEADGVLFLQLLSGRNPDYLIEHQIEAVSILEKTTIDYEYYAIDHFQGSEEHDHNVDYYEITRSNLEPILNRICLIKEDSIKTAQRFPDEYFNVIYIDASHDYESVLKDIETYYPKQNK